MKNSGMAKAIALLLASAASSIKADSRPPKDPDPVDVTQFGVAGDERYMFCHADCPRRTPKHKKVIALTAPPLPADEIPVVSQAVDSPALVPPLVTTSEVVTPPTARKPLRKRTRKRKIHCTVSH